VFAEQQKLNTPRPWVDENGRQFPPGERVLSRCILHRPRTIVSGPPILVEGAFGVIEEIRERAAGVRFEGWTGLYWIGKERMKVTVEVVG